jgi:hypothetical protein
MAVTYRVPANLLVDRYYRGAVVMVGTTCYALPEPFVGLLEHVRQHPGQPLDTAGQPLAEELESLGVLTRQ